MKIKIITGLAGGGKSTVLNSFEDMGFYCIDNMPPNLLLEFVELIALKDKQYQLAVVMDLRLGEFFEDLEGTIDDLKKKGHDVELLFVDASDSVILNRYKATRRAHPLEDERGTLEAIEKEREILSAIRRRSDYVFDTTYLNIHELKQQVMDRYQRREVRRFQVVFVSFGFKKGILQDADYVFDLRMLRNPYYNEQLRELTGIDQRIRDYIFADANAKEYFFKLKNILDFLIQAHKEDNRYNITIGLGCTGGKHRSVTFAYLLSEYYRSLGYETVLKNRDVPL